MFNVDDRYRLPRILCYFDDIIGGETELYNDFTGVRLAIREFNEAGSKKLSPAYHLVTRNLANNGVVRSIYYMISSTLDTVISLVTTTSKYLCSAGGDNRGSAHESTSEGRFAGLIRDLRRTSDRRAGRRSTPESAAIRRLLCNIAPPRPLIVWSSR